MFKILKTTVITVVIFVIMITIAVIVRFVEELIGKPFNLIVPIVIIISWIFYITYNSLE